MTNKNNYEIIINDASSDMGIPSYEGKYKHKPGEHFVYIPVSFIVSENRAYICVTDSDAPTERILDFSADEIRDTLRKTYLYHLLHFGKELTPAKMTLRIDGQEYIYDDTTSNFPFMFSMLRVPSDFHLTSFAEELILKIIKESKSMQFKKDEYACLYAFLGGLGKEHYNDQFIYFWTAINAYYNLIAKEYNTKLGVGLDADATYQLLDENDQKTIKRILSLGGDEKNMHALSLLYSRDTTIKKARPTMLRNFDPNAVKDRRSDENFIIITMSTWFCEWQQWEDMLHSLKTLDANDEHLISLKESIFDKLRFKHIDPYAWVTFKFPYIFRCNSFHGSRAYLAFAGYNEPELKMVQGMCYAMRDFLNENIKNVFEKELLNEDAYKKIRFMCANYQNTQYESDAVQRFLKTLR
ncbi:MAG: hypothetical protein MJ105_07475 [Lachnospiraceae bacterium]|nr:hypothetical protein [Lachnospiraceae bacterium]